jgi:thiol-disulfide isomerase/thioredoxin
MKSPVTRSAEFRAQSSRSLRGPHLQKRLAVACGFAFALLATQHGTARAADAAASAPSRAVLNLKNDGIVTGQLQDHSSGAALRWQSPAFTSPFEFQLGSVSAVHFPAPDKLPAPTGEWCFELDQGTVLFGSLVGWASDKLEIDATRVGRVQVKPASIRRFYRVRDNGDVVYHGPSGLAGWQLTNPKAWREDFGHLAADQESSAEARIEIPDRAAIEFEISWKKKPDFVFALASGNGDEKQLKEAFRFEVWANDLVIQRELENEADPAEIQKLTAGPGRAHFQVFIDQNLGRCLVFSASGSKLADIKVTAANPEVRSGVRLDNLKGDIRLERLRVVRWTGDLPREVKADQPRVQLLDGNVVYGRIVRIDPATGEMVLQGEAGEVRVAVDRVINAFQSFPDESQSPAVRVGYHDGIYVGGDLLKIADGSVWMTSPAVAGKLRLPQEGLRSIIVVHPDSPGDGDSTEPIGTLELDGTRLRGRLTDGQAEAGASCLVWQPLGSTVGSHLRTGISGRIVYREPPPPPKTAQPQGRAGVARMMVVNGAVVQQQAPIKKPAGKGAAQPSLYLRTGDTIPCEVTKIDEEGVTFKTAISDSGYVPHAKIKAVELIRDSNNAPGLTAAKRNRLLTLPRMQRDSPPTHLIRSINGDYLRGRIVGMDEQNLKVEVRLDTRTIPRDRIARIIWLHAEDLKGQDLKGENASEEPDPPPQSPDTRDGRVQVLRSDGIRLTFVPDKFAEATLSGNSEVLGVCRVAMKQIDQLLIGSAIEQAAARLAYQQWKLQHATDPKFVSAGDGGEGGDNPGMESALVGKPAPEFELELLQGGRFKLAEMKGKVVVLDFWATWCGPCLAAMPQVDRAARAFAAHGVQLVAVNLEEAPKPIKSMLERHKLELTVALDRDGAVAGKYQANAIPQTVIIDKEGVVSRVFIGGNPHLEEQIKEALQKLLPNAKPAE